MSSSLLDKREVRIRRMFGDIAPRYDLLNHLLSLNIDRYWRWQRLSWCRRVGRRRYSKSAPGRAIWLLPIIGLAVGRFRSIGTDFCLPMLQPAAKKAQRQGASEKVRFLEADTQRLPFPDNTFQLTTVAFGLRNVTDTDRGLAEMVRVTIPGGQVAISNFRGHGIGCSGGCISSIHECIAADRADVLAQSG